MHYFIQKIAMGSCTVYYLKVEWKQLVKHMKSVEQRIHYH